MDLDITTAFVKVYGEIDNLKSDYKQKISALEADKKYLENESKHWRDFAYRLRAEKKAESKCEICKTKEPGQLGNKFCWNCGRNLKL